MACCLKPTLSPSHHRHEPSLPSPLLGSEKKLLCGLSCPPSERRNQKRALVGRSNELEQEPLLLVVTASWSPLAFILCNYFFSSHCRVRERIKIWILSQPVTSQKTCSKYMISTWRLIYKFPAQVGEGADWWWARTTWLHGSEPARRPDFREEMGVSAYQYLWRPE